MRDREPETLGESLREIQRAGKTVIRSAVHLAWFDIRWLIWSISRHYQRRRRE